MITRCLFRIAVAWLRRLSLVEQEAPAVPRVAPHPPLLHPLHPPALPRILARNRTTATMDMRLDTKHTMMSRPHGLTAPGPSASLTQARVPAEKWISDWAVRWIWDWEETWTGGSSHHHHHRRHHQEEEEEEEEVEECTQLAQSFTMEPPALFPALAPAPAPALAPESLLAPALAPALESVPDPAPALALPR